MTGRTFKLLIGATLLCAAAPNLFAQQPTAATDIPYGEIMTVYEHMGDSIDEQIRVVDIGDDINVAVGILRRVGTRTEGEVVASIIHHEVTEIYYILSGSGILVTGGEVVDGNEFPATVSAVRELIGPSGSRQVVNGETRTVGAGDVVVIPAGVPHGFRHIQDQVTYLSIRVDPNQTLPVGYAHPSLSE